MPRLLVALLIVAGFSISDRAQAQEFAAGKITMLRVHDVGTGYGPPADRIDVEVVIALDSEPGKAFGFQLRDDQNFPARQGMLSLLQDAFDHGWTVNIDHMREPGRSNSIIIRTWLLKQ